MNRTINPPDDLPMPARRYLSAIGRKGGQAKGATKARQNARLAALARWHEPDCQLLRNGVLCDCLRLELKRKTPNDTKHRNPRNGFARPSR